MRVGVTPDTRQGVPTMLTARGEFPEAAQEAPAVQGSFGFGTASLPRSSSFAQDDRANSQLARDPLKPRPG